MSSVRAFEDVDVLFLKGHASVVRNWSSGYYTRVHTYLHIDRFDYKLVKKYINGLIWSNILKPKFINSMDIFKKMWIKKQHDISKK